MQLRRLNTWTTFLYEKDSFLSVESDWVKMEWFYNAYAYALYVQQYLRNIKHVSYKSDIVVSA